MIDIYTYPSTTHDVSNLVAIKNLSFLDVGKGLQSCNNMVNSNLTDFLDIRGDIILQARPRHDERLEVIRKLLYAVRDSIGAQTELLLQEQSILL